MSNGAMEALLTVWEGVAARIVLPRNPSEHAVRAWLSERAELALIGIRLPPNFRPPLEAPFQSLEALGYFRRIVAVTAADLQRGGPPDEDIWLNQIGWGKDNRPWWDDRLARLSTALGEMVAQPEGLFDGRDKNPTA